MAVELKECACGLLHLDNHFEISIAHAYLPICFAAGQIYFYLSIFKHTFLRFHY